MMAYSGAEASWALSRPRGGVEAHAEKRSRAAKRPIIILHFPAPSRPLRLMKYSLTFSSDFTALLFPPLLTGGSWGAVSINVDNLNSIRAGDLTTFLTANRVGKAAWQKSEMR
jgi:hypothetical protein